jgi:hypothetical protein
MARKTTIAPETTANQETTMSQTSKPAVVLPELTPEQEALFASLTPEQKALLAVKAKHENPDAVKTVGKAARKATRLEKRANKKAAKCDPNSPLFNPDYARRVAVREANKAASGTSAPGVRTNAAKADAIKGWLDKTTLSDEQKAAVLAKVTKVSLRAMIGGDGVSTTGYRGTIKVKQAEGDDLVLRKTLTLATSKDMSLDQMKAEAETYIIHSLQKVAA